MDCGFDRAWAEIDLDRLVHNYRQLVGIISAAEPCERVEAKAKVKVKAKAKAKVMAVVKANAYGHGAVTVSRTLLDAGADHLAVASFDEAVELRKAGIEAPILTFDHADPDRAGEAAEYGLTQAVYRRDACERLSDAALRIGKRLKIHIKVDTGMTRTGFHWEHGADTILDVAGMPGIETEGIFTHFASANDADELFTMLQYERFTGLLDRLRKNGLEFPLRHVCNSAGIINHPCMCLDMVRPGISLYGCYPSDETDRGKILLKPVMALKARITQVSDCDAGIGVSYGRIFTTRKQSRIAAIPLGYADGYTRMLTGKAKVLVNGQLAPVVGRICMDRCMIDVTEISGDVREGDEVVLIGEQKGAAITADDLARLLGTINYEITCMVSRRIPRVFIKNGSKAGVENYLTE